MDTAGVEGGRGEGDSRGSGEMRRYLEENKQRSMFFNSMQREEPYLDLTWCCKRTETCDLRGCTTDAAWLSSARVVRCWVKSRNERNPCGVLPSLSWGLTPDCR